VRTGVVDLGRATMPRNRPCSQRGSVLIWTLFVVLIVGGYVLFGVQADLALDLATRVEVEAPSQARAVAEAGLVDAFAWLRRQPIQPVTAFAPKLDLTPTPPINETDDPAIGLVREYEIAPHLWARYEVRKPVAAEPFVDLDSDGLYDLGESYTDADGNGRWDAARESRDVSLERGLGSAGTVWLLVSHGMVFTRPRQDLALGEGPNRRLAIARVATEVRRMALTLPADAALCAARGADVTIGTRARILGGSGGGVVYASATGSPYVDGNAEVTGSPSTTAIPEYDGTLEAVFGVSLAELKSMSDLSTTDPAGVPSPLGDYQLTLIDGDITFDDSRPLRGTGIVVVLGDCVLSDGSNSFFNGLLWVGGDLTLRAPMYIRGSIVVEGAVDVQGTGGDYAEIDFDDGILTELLALMGQYRHSKAIHKHDQDSLRHGRTSVE